MHKLVSQLCLSIVFLALAGLVVVPLAEAQPVQTQSTFNGALSDGSAAVPALRFAGDDDTGLFLFTAGQLGLAIGGGHELTLTSLFLHPQTDGGNSLGANTKRWAATYTDTLILGDGDGSTATFLGTATNTTDLGSAAAGFTYAIGSVTVTGATVGDACFVSTQDEPTGLALSCRVSAANTVTINPVNVAGGDPPSHTFRVVVVGF